MSRHVEGGLQHVCIKSESQDLGRLHPCRPSTPHDAYTSDVGVVRIVHQPGRANANLPLRAEKAGLFLRRLS